ncbi:hypothetical protein GBA52_020155, partial [Prunus armeniaca]
GLGLLASTRKRFAPLRSLSKNAQVLGSGILVRSLGDHNIWGKCMALGKKAGPFCVGFGNCKVLRFEKVSMGSPCVV